MALILCGIGGSGSGAAAPVGWTQAAYVWQRQPGEAVWSALRESPAEVAAFFPLIAEIAWADGRARVTRVPWDFRALGAVGRPVGLVIRVGPYGGSFAPESEASRAVVTVVREALAAARAAGWTPAEVQLDFDCASGRLADYRRWLLRVRREMGGVPLVFTALPAWLRRREFAGLARAADGFVLQIHSLERPKRIEDTFTLCDPERSLAWVARASAVGVPFRVACPTYGYTLAFDPTGAFFALSAEQRAPAWPDGTRTREVSADPAALAGLVRTLVARRPDHCGGLIWFRLPVAGDRLNWSMPALAAVMRGEIPKAKLEAGLRWSENGLAEIELVNAGETRVAADVSISVTWPAGARCLSGDAIGGFRLEWNAGKAQGLFLPVSTATTSRIAPLAPGERRRVGWLRFDREHPLSVQASAAVRDAP